VAEETLNRDLAELRVSYAAGGIKDAVGVTGGTPGTTAALSEAQGLARSNGVNQE
jgi:hypothetical protein